MPFLFLFNKLFLNKNSIIILSIFLAIISCYFYINKLFKDEYKRGYNEASLIINDKYKKILNDEKIKALQKEEQNLLEQQKYINNINILKENSSKQLNLLEKKLLQIDKENLQTKENLQQCIINKNKILELNNFLSGLNENN